MNRPPAASPAAPLAIWRPLPRAGWVIVGLYGLLALAYNVVQPPFETSDEREHFGYVQFLLQEQRVPVFVPGEQSEYHQPPLYYLAAALLAAPFPARDLADYEARRNPYAGFRHWEPGVDNKNLFLHGPWDAWPFRDTALAVHVARLTSLLFGLLTVIAVYQVGRALLDEGGALAALGLAAFLPMFVSVSGSVQNDAGAAALGAVSLWLALRCHAAGFTARRAAGLGLVIGLGGLMKLTALLLWIPAAALLLFWAEGARRPWRAALGLLAWLGVGAALGGGWWYARNWLLFGEPTSLSANLATYAIHPASVGFAWWGDGLAYAWATFWGRIGWGELGLPNWVYSGLAGVTGLAAFGLTRGWRRWPAEQRGRVVALLLSGLVLTVALIGYITLSPTGAQGRYLYPALPAFGVLVVLGLRALAPRRARRLLTWAGPVTSATLSVALLTVVLIPAYTPPPALSGLPVSATRVDAVLGDVAVIRGYAVSAGRAHPGDRVVVSIFWEPLRRTALPYSVFVHLLEAGTKLIAQRDTYPGLGRNPTTAWEPGRLFEDRYTVLIPENVATPLLAFWKVGLWQAETDERAWLLDDAGQPVDSGLPFGRLELVPSGC